MKKCIVCGAEFAPRYRNRMTCSDICRAKHEGRALSVPIRCAQCGERLEVRRGRGRHRRFCSDLCRARNDQEVQQERHCATCGIVLDESAHALRIYCSDECRPKVERDPVPKMTKTCEWCNQTYQTHQSRSRFCSAQCRDRHKHHSQATYVYNRRVDNVRQRAAHWGVDYEPVSKLKLFERDNWTCYICGQPVDRQAWLDRRFDPSNGRYPSEEHVIPLSRGGSHTYANMRCACLDCNRKKHNRPLEMLLEKVAS